MRGGASQPSSKNQSGERQIMTATKYIGAPFLVIGIAFITLGAIGQRVFLAIGLAFLVLGIILFARSRRADR